MATKLVRSYKWKEFKSRSRRIKKSMGQRVRRLGTRDSSKTVGFVAGVQRSGTNMLMHVLDRSPDTEVYNEKDNRAFDEFAMREVKTISNLVDQSPAKCIVFKALLESGHVLELMSHFNDSKTIWLYRHYTNMINSYLVSWPGGRNRLDEIVQRPVEHIWQAKDMTQETLDLVRALYRPDLNDASALAIFWYYRNKLFFDQNLQNNPAVRLISYDHLLRDPELQIRKAAAFLNISETPAMSNVIARGPGRRRKSPDIEAPIRELCDGLLARLDGIVASD